jgi:hypothetical protein
MREAVQCLQVDREGLAMKEQIVGHLLNIERKLWTNALYSTGTI